MAYIGSNSQFDAGLTNPSKNPYMRGSAGGAGGHLINPPTGPTQPTVPTMPLKPTGQTAPTPQGTPSLGGDVYWPWPTTGPGLQVEAPKSTSTGSPPGSRAVSLGNTGAHLASQGQTIADYGEAPPIPTGGQTAGPITGAPSAQYYGYTPEKWAPSEMDIPEAGVNTREIVASLKPRLEEEMSANMGNAARRFGALGGLKGTGYATTLGAAERKMFEDLNALNYKYDYDAAQSDANRKSAARENALNRELSGYGTYTGAMGDEASRHTNFGLTQQQIANDLAKTNANLQNTGVQINNAQDWNEYTAGLSEAERKQLYDQMMLDYGG